jgi:hypothetical protein
MERLLYLAVATTSDRWADDLQAYGRFAMASQGRINWPARFVAIATLMLCPAISHADEGGVSFWLPGQYASLAATPQVPGWAMGVVYLHSNVAASGSVAAARQITVGRIPANVNVSLDLSLRGQADLVVLSPTYTFATPVLGGQLSMGVASWFGRSSGSLAGTLTAVAGPIVATRSGVLSDTLVSYGDIVPTVSLRWNQGVNNYMVYATGDIPAGDYSPTRLANLGIGHGTVDVGGAYTYLNQTTGNEFSATAGFTYNFKNPDTQYRNGVDFHFDWGAAHFITKQVFVGLAGYAYQQITDDSGQSPILGGFRSRVLGIGPQIGYAFPLGDMQGFLGLRGYGDFDAANRAPGWSTWLTFAISPSAPTVVKPVRQMFTK